MSEPTTSPADPTTTEEPAPDPKPESMAYMLFVLILSGLSLVVLAARTMLPLTAASKVVLDHADNIVCGLFLIDFAISMYRSDKKLRYFLTWGWLDLVSSVPMVEPFRLGRIARMIRIVRVLRSMRSTRILTGYILQRRAQGAFLASSLITGVLLVFGSVAILQFETGPDANIQGPQDALWWSIVTLTTVGYGDRFPITMEGRLIAAMMMIAGVGLFGSISGFVSSWFLGTDERAQEEELRQVHAELLALRKLLQEKNII